MNVADLTNVKKLHHAYLVAGNAAGGAEEVMAMLRARGVTTAGNPDFYAATVSELTADVAREAMQFASLKPLGDAKYIVIGMSRATPTAQNALLKVIEDAPGGTTFFFSIDSAGHVLPTIRSRCIIVSAKSHVTEEDTEEAKTFAYATFEARLKLVEKMTSYISKTQDRAPVRSFVGALMRLFHKTDTSPEVLRDILDADRYLRMQGSSAKAVLGHLAVTLPRTSR